MKNLSILLLLVLLSCSNPKSVHHPDFYDSHFVGYVYGLDWCEGCDGKYVYFKDKQILIRCNATGGGNVEVGDSVYYWNGAYFTPVYDFNSCTVIGYEN
ncbi:MAG TPA: hypothetical protein P5564_06350 [Paludibacteraceae bacterium]|nr:hypothetical protein [Paludibacteraceae bacterium]